MNESNCCGAPLVNGICRKCGEHAVEIGKTKENKMNKKIIKLLLRLLCLWKHDYDLGIKDGKIHKFCTRCKNLINTGI